MLKARKLTFCFSVPMLCLFGMVMVHAPRLSADLTCPHYTNGYSSSTPVPCSNATCADSIYQPEQLCSDGTLSFRYTATTAPGWTICNGASNPSYPACNESPATCANVYVYNNSNCVLANRCNTTTILACAYGTN